MLRKDGKYVNFPKQYNQYYEEGHRYCQCAYCEEHLTTRHKAFMIIFKDLYFCSERCKGIFFDLNRQFFVNNVLYR